MKYSNNVEIYELKSDLKGKAYYYKDSQTRPISDGFRKNNVNYWAFREIRSIIPHL